jgi:hypothetical protein
MPRFLVLQVLGLCILSALPGCAVYTLRPVDVVVVDAESGKPVQGAEVGVDYLALFILNRPWPASGKTDSQGKTSLWVANFHDGSENWSASAPDYLPFQSGGMGSDSRNRIPCDLVPPGGSAATGPAVIHLYRKPAARIMVIVPDGYRGPLKIDLHPVPEFMAKEPGARQFTFSASSNGYVGIQATPILLHLNRDIEARYANGDPIPQAGPSNPNVIALRYVTTEGNINMQELYVVGTADDKAAVSHAIFEPDKVNQDAWDRLFESGSHVGGPAKTISLKDDLGK